MVGFGVDGHIFSSNRESPVHNICQLETRHRVRVGTWYVNENAGKEFVHYIAESRRQELRQTLANAKFFSLLLDGSTDAGRVRN